MNLEKIQHPFIQTFPGDFSDNSMQRKTPKLFFAKAEPATFTNPRLIIFNKELSQEIGLGNFTKENLPFLVGNNLPENIIPYATAYSGHQFGNWAGQLGDGRAIFAGEISNDSGQKTEIQWKGAGATPYSRFADGRAVLRSSLREYLCSESMNFLGIPTTRALSLCLSSEEVVRDFFYNGNPQKEKGAIIIRTAESFLRFGHFENFSAQKEISLLKNLTDFTIKNYFPKISADGSVESYKNFFTEVCERTAKLIVEWMRVGFTHGVMNTDNMSVLGLTIDYGPFSFLDQYDLNFTPNTTDLPGRRYAFGRQGEMAQWNLWQLANALFPLIHDPEFLESTLNYFSDVFWKLHDEMLSRKFGFENNLPYDESFFNTWQNEMQRWNADYTLFFARLEIADKNSTAADFADTFYGEIPTESFNKFLKDYFERIALNKNPESRKSFMAKANPKFILRNYMLFECIQQVENNEFSLLETYLEALKNPYSSELLDLSPKRPAKYNNVAGCSTLSCSS